MHFYCGAALKKIALFHPTLLILGYIYSDTMLYYKMDFSVPFKTVFRQTILLVSHLFCLYMWVSFSYMKMFRISPVRLSAMNTEMGYIRYCGENSVQPLVLREIPHYS